MKPWRSLPYIGSSRICSSSSALRRSGHLVVVAGVVGAAVGLVAGAGGATKRGATFSPPATPQKSAPPTARAGTSARAPGAPAVAVCGVSSLLSGPAVAPAGAVTVPAGDDSSMNLGVAHTVYWFAPGVHTLGSGPYGQIVAGQGSTYVGGPGAVLSGQGVNHYAISAPYNFIGVSDAQDVTVEYLTIENFVPAGGNGAVNGDAGSNWTITHNTIEYNTPGAAVMLGSNDTLSWNCLTRNGEYGFNAYVAPSQGSDLTGGPVNVTVSDNEISYNDTYNWEAKKPGCGCSGGGKFWAVDGATVKGNYVHDNANVGLWADTNNDGFTITGNYIAHNYSAGLMYEISYNAVVANNTFADNAWGVGPTNPGFPSGAVYISESGGDARVPNPAGITSLSIIGNVFTDNWDGVVLWENSNRFCGSPDNTSSGNCTLVSPSTFTTSTCNQANLQHATPAGHPDYYDGCRWKTQNVYVANNTFTLDPGNIPSCKPSASSCGMNALFSEYCSNTSNGIGWSPYCSDNGYAVPAAITTTQNNHFADNSYNGPWTYKYYSGNDLTQTQWLARHQR